MTVIEQLEALLVSVTTRPWEVEIDHEYGSFGVLLSREVRGIRSTEPRRGPADPRPPRWVVRFDDDYGTDQGADAALIVATVNALPDLLKLARVAYDDHLKLPWHPDPCATCDALMAVFRETPSGEPHEQREEDRDG